ncbi:regulator of RNase E activity RraA [Arthrobacter stackebrandtii]|uniref:Putative 4-hydroxy-4-methyl-2-oxoglutarate aldolase n=1 Tax=Arthrobacter stackebrandtii TaxID=272161 RepID=A0ABS4Z1R3_9MICC|nr:RraA family protein [Arthrobacter stackebrandtii]MBP2414665.1 regulator of RNase E activity RraA [Arthrobacter stackebrandtii]PYH01758.1 diguanylate cyclase [Arthrobacter stackebrandtii]
MNPLPEFASPTDVADQVARSQVLSPALHPLWSGARLSGPAYTVRCAPGDNLMLHAAIHRAPAGSVLVVDGGDASHAVAGGNVCAVAHRRGIAGMVIDGAIRDVSEIRGLGFPVFARAVVPKPGVKAVPLPLQEPVTCGGVLVYPGDFIVADEEGIVAVPAADVGAVMDAVASKVAAERAQGLDAWASAHDEKINSILRAAGLDW